MKSAFMVYRKESVLKRLEKLREYATDLRPFGELPAEDFSRSRNDRYAVERILFLMAECVIDILDHLLSAGHGIVSDSYEDVIQNAHNNGIIPKGLYENLKGLGGFRNILAHGYLQIKPEEVHRNMKKMIAVSGDVIEHFRNTL